MPPAEEILTIAPPPALRIEGTIARIPRYVPVRLMSITWRQTAGSVSVIGPKRTMPALLISTGDRPEGVFGGGHCRGPVCVARNVETGEDRLIAELFGERPSLLLEYVRDHDVRALGDEAARVAGTHSTRAAGHDHRPVIETSHDSSPSIRG